MLSQVEAFQEREVHLVSLLQEATPLQRGGNYFFLAQIIGLAGGILPTVTNLATL